MGFDGAGSIFIVFISTFLGFGIFAFFRFLTRKGFKAAEKLDDRISKKMNEKNSHKSE